jgi:hypothetical protein
VVRLTAKQACTYSNHLEGDYMNETPSSHELETWYNDELAFQRQNRTVQMIKNKGDRLRTWVYEYRYGAPRLNRKNLAKAFVGGVALAVAIDAASVIVQDYGPMLAKCAEENADQINGVESTTTTVPDSDAMTKVKLLVGCQTE